MSSLEEYIAITSIPVSIWMLNYVLEYAIKKHDKKKSQRLHDHLHNTTRRRVLLEKIKKEKFETNNISMI